MTLRIILVGCVGARLVTLFIACVAVVVVAVIRRARATVVPMTVAGIKTHAATLSITRLEPKGRSRIVKLFVREELEKNSSTLGVGMPWPRLRRTLGGAGGRGAETEGFMFEKCLALNVCERQSEGVWCMHDRASIIACDL